MLLGAAIFWDILCTGQLTTPTPTGINQPVLQNTKLGWIVGGSFQINNGQGSVPRRTSCNHISTHLLDAQVKRCWEVEQYDNKQFMSPDDQFCENQFTKSEGRFVVKLPFKEEPPQLEYSKETALKRFLSLESKLEKQQVFKREYTNVLGRLLLVPKEKIDNFPSFYLPHHGVLKESSLTTKVRIVFDASMKSSNGLSLNDTLHAGPTLQNDLFSIVCRFRTHQYVISADITKMYRQICLESSHWDYQRVFWRNNPSEPIQIYNLTTITFGVSSSPYLAIRCLKQLPTDNQNQFPTASTILLNDFYVDDLLSGANTIAETKLLRNQLIEIW